MIIGSRAQAEEIVQNTWLAVVTNIGDFEGRSSLATWLFAIASNRARTCAKREARTVALGPPSALDESKWRASVAVATAGRAVAVARPGSRA